MGDNQIWPRIRGTRNVRSGLMGYFFGVKLTCPGSEMNVGLSKREKTR